MESVATESPTETESHVKYEECVRSDTLLVAFAGNAGLYGGMPTFEFSTIMQDIPVEKLFLRDPHKMWYQKGIPGIGHTIDEVAGWVRSFAARHGVRRIVTVGNSGGGYAALVFGALLDADEVHAFVPQARLTDPGDSHKSERIRNVRDDPASCRQYLNVRALLLRSARAGRRPAAHIYFCTSDSIDVRHVQRLSDIDGVRAFGFEEGGHDLIRVLKQNGILPELLHAALLEPGHGRRVTHWRVWRANAWFRVRAPFRWAHETARSAARSVREGVASLDFLNL